MRHPFVTLVAAVAMAMATAAPAAAQHLQLADLGKLAPGAVDVVDVSVDKGLLGLAAAFMSDAEDASVKAMLGALQGIYVRGYTYGKDGAYDAAVLDGLRRQLTAGRWSRIVTTRSAEAGGTEVSVYLWNSGERPGGLAVLSSSPREVMVVNIVGDIDLAKLRSLKGQFGVPDFDLGSQGGPRKRD